MNCPVCNAEVKPSNKNCKQCQTELKFIGKYNQIVATKSDADRVHKLLRLFQGLVYNRQKVNACFLGASEAVQLVFMYNLLARTREFLAQQQQLNLDSVSFLEDVLHFIFTNSKFDSWADNITSVAQCGGTVYDQAAISVFRGYTELLDIQNRQANRVSSKRLEAIYEPIL